MRIAVNTRLLLPDKLEGIGWFTQEVFSRITRLHPEHEFIYFFDRAFDPRFVHAANVTPVALMPPTRHPLLYRAWFEHVLPWALRKHRADVFVSPDGFLSTRTDVPQIAVMHDLNFEHRPKDMPAHYSRYYRSWFPRFARKAARIITVSEFSKLDIVSCYGIDPWRIDVAHNGVGDAFSPLSDEEASTARDRFTGGRPYFVCVGSLHPRKNTVGLLRAFDAFAEKSSMVRLVIAGERLFYDEKMAAVWRNMKHKDRVIFTGRMGQRDLRLAVGAATALVIVSHFEGFGIPILEAMKCGVPVIASQATSLPEVAGDAAVYCDPVSVDSIANAMLTMWDDAGLRERLAAAGLERAKRFTWDATAEKVWESIEHVINEKA